MKRHIAAAVIVNLALVGILALFVWWTAPPFNMPLSLEPIHGISPAEFRSIKKQVAAQDSYLKRLGEQGNRLAVAISFLGAETGHELRNLKRSKEYAFTWIAEDRTQLREHEEQLKKIQGQLWRIQQQSPPYIWGCPPWRQ